MIRQLESSDDAAADEGALPDNSEEE